MEIIRLDTADSTNSWVISHEKELPQTALVYCNTQTAGRGQRGNSWESAPGKNITASLIFHPKNFPAQDQFAISESIALGIVDFLKKLGVEARIKWPNDIYVEDKKICGILVEHAVVGQNIYRTVAGMGININQTEFVSDAPNPVSLKQLTGKHYDIAEMVEKLAGELQRNITSLQDLEEFRKGEGYHSAFLDSLWRNDGNFHPFFDRKANEEIYAKIYEVAPSGVLTLRARSGENREYYFKEVEFLL